MHSRHNIRQLSRLVSTVFISVALLFSQIALSAYACPMQLMSSMEQQMANTADCCADSANAAAGLCHEHCKDSQLATPDALPAAPDFVAAHVITLDPQPLLLPTRVALPLGERERPSPPLSVVHCRFRI